MPSRFLTVSIAIGISLLINIAAVKSYLNHAMQNTQIVRKVKEIPLEIISSVRKKKTFIDTKESENNRQVESDLIAENSAVSDSAKQGDIKSSMPAADLKGLLPQARKNTTSLTAKESMQAIQKKVEQMKKAEEHAKKKRALEDKVSVLKKEGIKKDEHSGEDKQEKREEEQAREKEMKKAMEKEVQAIKEINTELMPPAKADIPDVDLFPLPMISLGENTFSEKGYDSFQAQGSGLGKYLKQLREKIGLKFHQMVLFHYKTNYIFESKTSVEFSIAKDGSLKKLETFFIEGDPMFPEYCKTVVNAASPFLVIPDSIDRYLEDDNTLKIKFMFGYNIRDNKSN